MAPIHCRGSIGEYISDTQANYNIYQKNREKIASIFMEM